MKKKTHTRAPGMGQTSITVPNDLLKKVGRIASKETRSRNKQIEHFLRLGAEQYEKENKKS